MPEKYSTGVAQFLPANLDLLVGSLSEYQDHLSLLVIKGLRNPAAELGPEEADQVVRMRLGLCRAFGRDIDRPSSEQDVHQYGLYGTAAALEILSHAKHIEQFNANRADLLTPQARELAETLLMLWNFLAFAIEDLSQLTTSKWWKQTRTTLRNCAMLCALASLRKPLKDIAEQQQETPSLTLASELSRILSGDYIKRMAKILFSSLKSAYTPYSRVPASYRLRFDSPNISEAFTFSFATDSAGLPGTWNEWLFLSSSVLIAMTRAFSAGLLTSDEISEIFKVSSIDRMREVTKKSSSLDQRVRLFALYSLLQLDGDESKIPGNLLLSDKQKQWLLKEVSITAAAILKNSVALIDSHIPYEIRFRRDGKTEYHDDYFVVPVVPILLTVIARTKSAWLFRPKVKSLINSWAETGQANRKNQSDIPIIVPYQLGEYNGTVNSLYYKEAATYVAHVIKERRGKGIFLALWGYVATNWRSFLTAFSGIGLLGIAYFLQTKGQPSDALLGAGLTLVLSWLARLLYDLGKKIWMG
ncbi:MAG TPA: hypothetical protein VF789_12895 [Thermoanaerobaculia bacterium]